MATLNLTFSTGSVTLADLNNSLAAEFNYPETVPDPATPGQTIPNPQSKADFNRRVIADFIRSAYRNGKRKTIIAAAEATVPDININ